MTFLVTVAAAVVVVPATAVAMNLTWNAKSSPAKRDEDKSVIPALVFPVP